MTSETNKSKTGVSHETPPARHVPVGGADRLLGRRRADKANGGGYSRRQGRGGKGVQGLPRSRRQGRRPRHSQSRRAARALHHGRVAGIQGRQARSRRLAGDRDRLERRPDPRRRRLLRQPAAAPAGEGGRVLALRERQGGGGGLRALPRRRRQQHDRRHAQSRRAAADLFRRGHAGISDRQARIGADGSDAAQAEQARYRKRGAVFRLADTGRTSGAAGRRPDAGRAAHRGVRRLSRLARREHRRGDAEPRRARIRNIWRTRSRATAPRARTTRWRASSPI